MYLLLYIAHGDTIPSPTIPLPLCIRVLLALNGVHYATHRQGREICKRFFFISFWPVSKYISPLNSSINSFILSIINQSHRAATVSPSFFPSCDHVCAYFIRVYILRESFPLFLEIYNPPGGEKKEAKNKEK